MSTPSNPHFERQYQTHLKHLKLKGLQPKTIEAYSRAIRRAGARFDHQIDSLTEAQLAEYFLELVASHSWNTVKLDLYGLKFYYQHVLRQPFQPPRRESGQPEEATTPCWFSDLYSSCPRLRSSWARSRITCGCPTCIRAHRPRSRC